MKNRQNQRFSINNLVFQRMPAPSWYISLDPLTKDELIRNVQAKKQSKFIDYCKMKLQFSQKQVNQFV